MRGARTVEEVGRLIDLPFYGREAGRAFASPAEAAVHLLSTGEAQGLSPSPFLLWPWIRSLGAASFVDFLAASSRVCPHPALRPDLYFALLDAVAGDLAGALAVLSRLDLDRAPLLPGFAAAARAGAGGGDGSGGGLAGGRAGGGRNILPFMEALSARRCEGPALEMPLFSGAWYVDAYEDVALSGENPFRHYVAAGWREGRDPSPAFSTARYLERHPDVRRVGLNPLIHRLGLDEAAAPPVDRSTATADLVRHAFKRGRSPAEYVPFDGDEETVRELCDGLAGTRLVIVVPFFRNEGLVEAACAGLLACAGEIAALGTCVLLVNDSPDHAPLGSALRLWAGRLGGRGFAVALFEAERNRGFIGSTNIGLRCADILSCACLMLNSDAVLRPGSLTEMVAVAALDDRFAFVSPLSNNATIATLGLDATDDADAAAAEHAAIAGALPRYGIVPTCVGFCLLVRPEVIALFGYLDPAYGRGYHEENDYVMRANRKGYLSVLAGRAFCSHLGEGSFATAGGSRAEREAANLGILRGRYPEFEGAVERYFASPEARTRRVVERHARAVDVVFDVSGVPGVANGTSVLARALVPRLVRRLGPDRCAVRCSADRLSSLGLAEVPGLLRWDPGAPDDTGENRRAKLGVRLSQPFRRGDVAFLSDHAARLAVFMLDTISDDCLHLREREARDLWEWVGEHADALLFNSPYSRSKFETRFAVDPRALRCASYHSLDVADYGRPAGGDAAPPPAVRPFLLIVGNHFQHKGLALALDATAGVALPRVLLGAKLDRPGLVSFDSGRLSRGEVELLYGGAAVVLFPSLYEGFGFPLMEGLAAGRPVIAHANALTRDIARRLGSPPGLLLFDRFADLPGLIAQATERAMAAGGPPPRAASRAGDGWDRSVEEIAGALEAALARPLDCGRVLARQKALSRLA